jgi:biotin synthase-related radical SAM superfamily protein
MIEETRIDMLELKGELLTEGVRATPRALEGVGTIFKEQNHGLFGWDLEDHGTEKLPDDFLLPDETVVQFRKNSRSPFMVDQYESGKTLLLKSGEEVCPVSWIPRPSFYAQRTSDGTPMLKIGQVGGEDCFFICYNNYCTHFSGKKQCLFCNLVDTARKYRSVLTRKEADQIGEVAAAAFREGKAKHILMTGGCFGNEKEVEVVETILGAIRKHTGFERIPGTILPSPPGNLDNLRRYHDAGIEAIGFSLEIWDEALYRALCPGKSSNTPRKIFVDAVKKAIRVFGPGNVYGVFVMGLEPADSLSEGVDALSALGAHIVPFVWSPNPGSRLFGHRAPRGSWYADNVRRFAEIVSSKGIPRSIHHCRKCDGNNMLHDALTEKSPSNLP